MNDQKLDNLLNLAMDATDAELSAYAARPQVEFVEKPKRLYFALFQAKAVSCIRQVQGGQDGPERDTGDSAGGGCL